MRTLNWQLKALCHQNLTGSHTTRQQRSRRLAMMATQLYELGYRHLEARTLKPKHVDALVAFWRERGIADVTIENRLSDLRWWARAIGRPGIVHADNVAYGISPRLRYAIRDKSKLLDPDILEKVRDAHVAMSLRLQAAFGLRKSECIKFIPSIADRTDRDVPHIYLKHSWCKSGRNRLITITNPEQLEVLADAYALVGHSSRASLIPRHKSYIQQRRRYDHECRRIGLAAAHGLRHAYAQRRYLELTGYDAPILGGQAPADLDGKARDEITEELGHGRREIVASYVGRLPRD